MARLEERVTSSSQPRIRGAAFREGEELIGRSPELLDGENPTASSRSPEPYSHLWRNRYGERSRRSGVVSQQQGLRPIRGLKLCRYRGIAF